MKNLKFSVVIPLYNKANHILEAVQSILSQSVPVDEVIVVNDGSTDNGAQILSDANLPKVRLINQENQGVSVARNRGIWEADNDYIAFLDADDLWLPFFLEEMQHLIEKFPQSQYFASRYQCVDGDNYVDAKIAMKALDPDGVLLNNYFELAGNGDLPFMISSSMVKRSLIDVIGGFPPGERIGEDQDFFARAAMQGPIAYSPNIHLMYRRDGDNSATSNWVPEEECPFSVRLKKQVTRSHQMPLSIPAGIAQERKAPQGYQTRQGHQPVQKHVLQAKPIDKYCAAHLCHLAKLNIFKGRYQEARKLLGDARCNLKAKHKWGLLIFSYLKQTQKLFTNTRQFTRPQ